MPGAGNDLLYREEGTGDTRMRGLGNSHPKSGMEAVYSVGRLKRSDSSVNISEMRWVFPS